MSKFPQLTIRTKPGSPSGASAEVRIDGAEPKGVHRIEIVYDVADAIRARLYQFVEVDIDHDVVMDVESRDYIARVRRPDIDAGTIRAWDVIAEGRGATLKAALLAAAASLPEATN